MAVIGYDNLKNKADELFLNGSYKNENFQPGSYELRAGREEILIGGKYSQKFNGETLDIPPHQIAFLSSEEILNMPKNILGEIILRFAYSHKGLILLGGHVDPLFSGRLTLVVENLSDSVISIVPGDALAIIVFHEVKYENIDECELSRFKKTSTHIDSEIISSWKDSHMFEVHKQINSQKKEIDELQKKIEVMDSTSQLVITGGIVLIAITILSVVMQFIFSSWNSSLSFISNIPTIIYTNPIISVLLIILPIIVTFLFMVFMIFFVFNFRGRNHK